MVTLAVLAVLYTLYFARAVLLPMTFSIVIALILRPLMRMLDRRGLPAIASALFVVGGAGLLIGVAVSLVMQPATAWVAEIPEHLSVVSRRLDTLWDTLAGISSASEQIEKITKTPGEERPIRVQVEQPAINNPVVGQTGTLLTYGAVSTVLVFFLLVRFDALTDAVLSFLEVDERREQVREAMIRVEQGLSRYLFTVTIINACLGVATGTVLWLLGMPNALLWGIMAMLFNYVPFIGAWTGTLIVGLVAAVTFSAPLAVLAPPVAFLTLTSIEGNVITPMILGRSMRLDPLILFASLVVFGWMWGIVGAILAVPMLAITKTVCEQFHDGQPVARLIGGESKRVWGSDKLTL